MSRRIRTSLSLCVSLSVSAPFDNCVTVFQIIYNSVLISPWNQIFIKKKNLLNWIVYTKTNDCLLQFSTTKADLTAMPAMSSVCFDLFLSFLRCCYFCCHSLRHCDTYVQMCVHLLFYNGVNNIKSSFMGVHIEIGTDTKHEFDTSVEFQFVFIFSSLFCFAFFISFHLNHSLAHPDESACSHNTRSALT